MHPTKTNRPDQLKTLLIASNVLLGTWGISPLPIYMKVLESWSKVGHAARELAIVSFVVLLYLV